MMLITLGMILLGISSRTWARSVMPAWMLLYGGDFCGLRRFMERWQQ